MSSKEALGVTAACVLAACGAPPAPTIHVDLVTAPGSTLLDRVDRLRVRVLGPTTVYEATRDAGGLSTSFDVEADSAGDLVVEGFDSSDLLIAAGQSPQARGLFEVDASVTIYVATPFSIEEAPVRLSSARAGIAATSLVHGAVFAGGRDESSDVSDVIEIYDAYHHNLTPSTMPMQRTGVTLAGVDFGGHEVIILFGGTGPDDAPTSSLFFFDSTKAEPFGAYTDLGDQTGLERTGQRALVLAANEIVITGAVPGLLDLSDPPGVIIRPNTPPLSSIGAELHTASGDQAAALASGSIEILEVGTSRTVTLPTVRDGAAILSSPQERYVVVGGAETSAFVISATDPTGAVDTLPGVLETVRFEPTVGSVSRYLIVAGGVDATGTPIPSAEILDVFTLAHVATVPIAPRRHAVAVALPNGQLALVGGDDPTDLIELFTPPPPNLDAA